MTIKNLVINAGSSSAKFQIFVDNSSVLSGVCEEIGSERAKLKVEFNGDKEKKETSMKDHKEAFSKMIDILKEKDLFEGIDFVAHRVVHGGEEFKTTTLIDDEVIRKLEELSSLAPLHNPPNIEGVKVAREFFPKAKHFAVFDTAFHQTMPEKSYLYGVPYEWYAKHGVRRYGFHGSSHKYVIGQAVKALGKKNSKIISCHLGNGASICAALDGKSIDTSMGMTPLEGLTMGTRSGSIDPAIIFHIMEKENFTHGEVDKILNKASGILGVSELSSDMREIEGGIKEGHKGAKRALDLFCHNVTKIIGSYITELNGVDAIIFTGGIGEKGSLVREYVAKHLEFLGVSLDEEKNKSNFEGEITTADSKVKLMIIPTNEELQMTLDCEVLI